MQVCPSGKELLPKPSSLKTSTFGNLPMPPRKAPCSQGQRKMVQSPIRPNYEVRVGMFTMFALIILFWGWGWLKSMALFQKTQHFTVQFHDVAGLNKSAPVNINGVRVGIIEDLEL